MAGYIVKRLLWAAVTVLGVLAVTFVIGFLAPSDPARIIAGAHASPATIRAINRLYGFNLPFYVQFVRFLVHVVQGNVGISYHFHQSAMALVLQRLPATLFLGVFAVAAELVIGIPVGIYSALRRDTLIERVLSSSLIAGVSLPTFWFGVLLIYVFAFRLQWFPLGGFGGFGPSGLDYVVLPALTYGITGAAYYARILRATLIENLAQDYVRTAHAKGLSASRVFVRHVWRNALIPFVTQLGMDLAMVLGGLVILEQVFDWPGIGSLVVQAIQYLDVPVILATTVVGAILVVVLNLVVDLLYVVLDPRITYQ
jgi:peptide/nickel transport system permease protein